MQIGAWAKADGSRMTAEEYGAHIDKDELLLEMPRKRHRVESARLKEDHIKPEDPLDILALGEEHLINKWFAQTGVEREATKMKALRERLNQGNAVAKEVYAVAGLPVYFNMMVSNDEAFE